MTLTLAFDIYGTLINTHGITAALKPLAGEQAADFSRGWRDKQLEYSFRRGLMLDYVDFADCTRQALEYTCAALSVTLNDADKVTLMQAYTTLPTFADVQPGLTHAQQAGFNLFAFSNGSAAAVDTLLQHANIRTVFTDIISVEDIRTFKPNPAVYRHFLQRTHATAENTWLVSSNPFDVIGALSAGWRAAWIRRQADTVFDPWGVEPTLTLSSLNDLASAIKSHG